MTPSITRRTRVAVASLAAAALAAGAVSTSTAASAAEPEPHSGVSAPTAAAEKGRAKAPERKDKLGSHDRTLLERARANGDKRVTLLLATERGQTRAVADSVKANGGFTSTRNDRIGYVRATVPTSSVEKVAGLAKVLAVDLDEAIPLPDPTVDKGEKKGAVADVAAPGPSTPDDNPYMPTRETGSVDFREANPEWDGRGVTIGVIDSGVDLDHPALQETTTGDRKVVDWVTATDPIFDNDLTWRAMLTSVTGPTADYAEATWTLPGNGTYRINRFSESITAASEPGGDVNRDGDTTDRFGVLYDPATNDIWVDADQDRVFAASEKMRPYKETFDVRHFGTDDPATDIVERMPFVVEFREDVDLSPYGGQYVGKKSDFVNIGIVEDAHGSHVAGIAAGHSLFGGAMNGQAPGAEIVSSRACTWGGGCTAAALTDGMVDLVANRGVDVVNMSIGGLPALNDGNNARARLYDALIDVYGVQLFISAGNSGAGINTIGDPSVATDVVSVASSISKETWLANYGSEVSTPLTLHNYSSRGPREDGGFKPNVMAPGSAVSTVPQWLKQADVAETGYTLPVGYAMFNGTSMASPQAAGAAALLLSASFDTRTAVTPAQLRSSMFSTADFVKGVEAVSQGTGQVDVPEAWKVLRTRPATQTYATDAPVCTAISDFLATPDRGTGVYNRCAADEGGQQVGQSKRYAVELTRTSGAGNPTPHTVKLVGDDGTFSVQPTVTLRKDRAQTVDVVATPRTKGLHSAILEVDDPTTKRVVDHRVMVAVVASDELSAPSFSVTASGEVERNLVKRHFVTVPEGTKALQVNLGGIAADSQVRWIAFNPYGVPVDPTATTQCYTNFGTPTCKPASRAYANPIPGVWELIVEARRTSPFLENPYRLTAAAQGVTVSPSTQTVTAPVGQPTPVTWTVKNEFGPVSVTPTGGSLGSALAERKTIADHELQTFEVVVPEGAERLDVAIGNTSDLGADLDLYVYRGTTLVGQAADGDSEEAVSIRNPAAGTYTIEVDGYSVPSGSTEYDYRDVFFSAELGTLTVPAGEIALDTGESVDVTGSLTASAAAAAGRQLFGEMNVLSPEGAVLGTGSVLVAP